MGIPKKRCNQCRRWFSPYPRKKDIQETCSRRACQRERHRQACEAFHQGNPGYDKGPRPKTRPRRLGYWQRYRATHPDYRLRDNARRQKARRKARRAATRDALREISVGKLRSIQAGKPQTAATRDALARRVDGIVDFLVWKESPQHETLTLIASP